MSSHRHPNLIFINGPVSAGKTTLAQRYIAEHRLAMAVNFDEIVGSMGQWIENEAEAQRLALDYIATITTKHLHAGYDVVVPFLLTNPSDMAIFERAAEESKARLFEFALMVPREEAIIRAIQRGSWGEPGSPPLTEADRPVLDELFDLFANGVTSRPHTVGIEVMYGDVEGTYQQIMKNIVPAAS